MSEHTPVPDSEPLLKSMTVEGGRMEITLEVAKELTLRMAESFILILGDANNYVEMDVQRGNGEAFLLRLQRRNGKSPHELRLEAEATSKNLLAALEGLLGIDDQEPLGPSPEIYDSWKSRRGVAVLKCHEAIAKAKGNPDLFRSQGQD